MKKVIISGFIILFFTPKLVEAETLRVPSGYPTIQQAISNSNDRDTIIVEPGTYHETINFLGKNITVTSADPNDPEIVANTIIDADGDGSTVIFENGESHEAILIGFTITGGYGTLNTAYSGEIEILWGGGIYCLKCSPTITRNVLVNNNGPFVIGQNIEDTELSYGGAICCIESTPIITRNIIHNNTAYAGAGILTYLADARISNNLIYNNSALAGGGVVLIGGQLINNTIVGNDASLDGQIGLAGNVYIVFSPEIAEIVSTSIQNNIICDATSGGGIYWEGEEQQDSIKFNNVWNNMPGNYAIVDSESSGGIIYDGEIDKTGTYGNISGNPLFVNASENDYHLQTGSICINTGNPEYIPLEDETDIDGKPRIHASRVDIGAYEYFGYIPPVANAGPDQHVIKQQIVTLDGSGSFFYDPTEQRTFYWHQIAGPEVVMSDPYAMQPTFFVELNGEYRFELMVTDGLNTSKPDEVLILVADNRPPVADAGPNRVSQVPGRVNLDGTGSYDLDNFDELTYAWIQLQGPQVLLQDANTATPFFEFNEAGIYVFELIVNDGFVDSEPSFVQVATVASTTNQHNIIAGFSTSNYFHYPDVSSSTVVYGVGSACDYTWDIKCKNLKTGKVKSFTSGGIDTQPKIDGDIVVWFGGPYFQSPWRHEPSNTSIFIRNIVTENQKTLRQYTWSESYSHPAISGNKVVWLEHLDLDPNPPGDEANRWWNTPYNVCGADITDFENPVYFTIAENVGSRDPYPCHTYSEDFDDVIDISDNIVVWEAEGDIYGADISNLSDIRIFTICNNPTKQYDPAICGNIVVWTDKRNDSGDIYGADISDIENIREMEIVRAPGSQQQPAIDESLTVYVEGNIYGGQIRACCLTKQYGVLDIALAGSCYGIGPAIDGDIIVWQTSNYGQAQGISLEFAYSTIEGPVKNLNTSKYYDYIQHAIVDASTIDQIEVSEGIYYENIDFKGKNLTLRSAQPNDPAVVDATIINGSNRGPAVTFSGGENENCSLSGFTIINGHNGICCSNASALINNCIITSNRSAGIKLLDQSNPSIANCIISGNKGVGIEMRADDNGRFVRYNYATITNCTIVGNIRQGIWGDIPTITNTIIYYNGSDCDNVQIQSYFATVTYSNIQGRWPGIGNIDADPCFASLGYWASVNDPNISVEPNNINAIWIEGDYHLKSQGWYRDTQREVWTWDNVTSPCIDAGNPGTALLDEPLSLPTDPNNEWGQNIRINIGAYGGTIQASIPPKGWALAGDLTNDGIVNFKDYGYQFGKSSQSSEDKPGDLNRNNAVDLTDAAILAEDWLNQTSWY